ncbi:substrate-binding domain-containing protein [soil metagenome]
MRKPWVAVLLCLLMILPVLAGCGWFGGSDDTLTVLAGSELKDLEPLFDQIRRNTGVELKMEYIGTLDGAEKLLNGDKVDLAWFSHGKYLSLLQSQNGKNLPQEKIMLSPVVLGVKASKAQAWGWVNNSNLTWREIAMKSGSGELHFAMTNPASSNSGFTALVGVAAALTGSGDALQVNDINNAELRTFFKGQALTAGSSGWLADSYVREQDNLDGMINYESVLLGLNAGNQLHEKLVLIYPKEGIITADYPLMLVNSDKKEQYDKLVAYLRSPDMQKQIMDSTLRRPVIPQVPLSDKFPKQLLVELPFPNSVEVIDKLLFAYLDEQRVPAHAFFVLDVSGSMEGERLDQLKTALNNLTGADQSLTGQFSRFRNREQVTMIAFSSDVQGRNDFTIADINTQGQSMQQVRTYVDSLTTNGGTAIYSALQAAYTEAAQAKQKEPDLYYSIVLMTDGENNGGISDSEFQTFYNSLPADVRAIRTFTVLFGEGNQEAMQAVADLTGGRMFDAKSDSLSAVFKQIRGYQ